MKRFHETRREANKVKKAMEAKGRTGVMVWDLKKSHPRRKKTRFFVGDHFEWLAI
jgi:hypothetical protein